MLGLLREDKVEEFIKMCKEKTLYDILEATAEFNNYRVYFKIDEMGNIKRKNANKTLIKLVFFGNSCLEEYFKEGLFIKEKRKLHKIDRLSQFDIKQLEKNIYKIFFNRDINMAYRYAKEFILKDKELFIKKIAHFVLLNELDTNKSLITLAFIKSLEKVDKKNIDFVLYSFLPYIVTVPSVIEEKEYQVNVIEMEKMDLNALSYLNLIPYAYSEYNRNYFGKLSEYAQNQNKGIEDKELFERLSEKKDELYEMWCRIN